MSIRYSCWNICVRFSIAIFYFPIKVVCMFWSLLRGIGYVIRGVFMGVVVSLMTIVLGASCSWTG